MIGAKTQESPYGLSIIGLLGYSPASPPKTSLNPAVYFNRLQSLVAKKVRSDLKCVYVKFTEGGGGEGGKEEPTVFQVLH